MLMAERQLKIINIIKEKGSVQVDTLSKELNVSKMTIRRDLEKLCEDGIVERCHGGAVYKQEIAYEDKLTINKKEKENLAKICASFIEEGNAIYLDAGTTTFEIAKRIMNTNNITVVSNDIEIARLLRNSNVNLVICGGNVQKNTGSIYGYYAMHMLENMKFDIGFFGTAAIDEQLNVMTPTVDKALLKKSIVSKCEKSFIVADKSKFNRRALTYVNSLTDYTYIVTNYKFKEEEIEILKDCKTQIIISE